MGEPRRIGRIARSLASLRHRNYRLYWTGQVVSLAGTWMQTVAQAWLVVELGGTPVELAAVVSIQYVPPTLLGPLAGVLADRFDKRRALMAVQLVAMIQAALLLLLVASGAVAIWQLFFLAAVLGFVNAFDQPLRQAFAAELVPPHDLMNAVALNSASLNLARMVGPALAGVAIAAFSTATAFGINALSYLVVLVCLALMDGSKLRKPVRPVRHPNVIASLLEGLRHVRSTPVVLSALALLAALGTFAMNFQTLLPLLARDLDLGPDGYAAMFAIMGAGSLAASLWLASFGGQRPLVPLILGAGLGLSALLVGLGVAAWPPLVYAILLAVGFCRMAVVNTINVTIQSNVGHAVRGRVMSLYTTLFAAGSPLGAIFAGSIAQAWGAPAAFATGGLISGAILIALGPRLMRAARARVGNGGTEPVTSAVLESPELGPPLRPD